MKEYLSKKTVGFYLSAIAAVLSIIGLVFYMKAPGMVSMTSILVTVAIIIEVIMIFVSKAVGSHRIWNLVPTVCAVLLSASFIISLPTQLNYLGWVVSGLYSINQIMQYVVYVITTVVALLLFVIASFTDMDK